MIGASATVLLVIALWTMRRARTLDGFHLADRGLGAFRGGFERRRECVFLLGDGRRGAAFTLGWSAIWLAVGMLLGAAFSWFVIGPAVRRRASAVNAGARSSSRGQDPRPFP